jgi:transcriptional regulator with XRE-family HTH domain
MKKPKNRKKRSRAPTDIDIIVGDNVRKLRLERNLTLTELGDALGISHQQLQKYETGFNRISAGMISNLADILGIQLNDLFEMPEDMKRGAAKADTAKSDKLRQQCHFIIDRTGSVEALQNLARVLKALSAPS